MQTQTSVDPRWALLTVWGVVNLVNLLQTVGFLSRVRTGEMQINHLLGYILIALSVPAALAMVAFWRSGAGWLYWIGPAVYLVFIALMVVVDYLRPVEFRSPMRYDILAPYLLLFFGGHPAHGLAHVPLGSKAVAGHRSDHGHAAGVDGRGDEQRGVG